MSATRLLTVHKLFLSACALILSLGLMVALTPARPTYTDTFTPTLTIDLTDINPGDSRCDTFPDIVFPGDQSILRAAI